MKTPDVGSIGRWVAGLGLSGSRFSEPDCILETPPFAIKGFFTNGFGGKAAAVAPPCTDSRPGRVV